MSVRVESVARVERLLASGAALAEQCPTCGSSDIQQVEHMGKHEHDILECRRCGHRDTRWRFVEEASRERSQKRAAVKP